MADERARELHAIAAHAIDAITKLESGGPKMVVKKCDPCGCSIMLEDYALHEKTCALRLSSLSRDGNGPPRRFPYEVYLGARPKSTDRPRAAFLTSSEAEHYASGTARQFPPEREGADARGAWILCWDCGRINFYRFGAGKLEDGGVING